MSEKWCAKCRDWKSTSGYHRNKQNADGLDVYCKSCRIATTRQWRGDNPNRFYELQKNNRTQAQDTERKARHRALHPARNFARVKLQRARERGLKLTHCSWPNCPETRKIEGHHPDYSEPYQIASLCNLHHKAADLLKDKVGFDLPIIDISAYLKPLKHGRPRKDVSQRINGVLDTGTRASLSRNPARALKPFHAGRVNKKTPRVDAGGTLFPTPLVCAGVPRVRHDSRSTDPGAKTEVTT